MSTPKKVSKRKLLKGMAAATVLGTVPGLSLAATLAQQKQGFRATTGTAVTIPAWKHRDKPHFKPHRKAKTGR